MKGMLQIGAVALLATTLVACGGSGNGSLTQQSPPPAANYDLQTGIANMVKTGLTANVVLSGSVTASGVTSSFSGSGTYTLSAGTNTTFNGTAAMAQTESISGTVTVAGNSQQISTSVTNYYATTNSAFLGENEGTEFDVAQAAFEWPTSITAGTSGSLGTVLRYTDSTMSVSLGKADVTYAVTAPATSNGPIGITVTEKIFDAHNNLTETDTTTYNMTSANVISFSGATANSNANSLVVTAH